MMHLRRIMVATDKAGWTEDLAPRGLPLVRVRACWRQAAMPRVFPNNPVYAVFFWRPNVWGEHSVTWSAVSESMYGAWRYEHKGIDSR